MRRSIKKSASSVGRTTDITMTETNEAPEDVELGIRQTTAPVQTSPPNVLEQARLGNLDLFRIELESGNHSLVFKAGPDVYFNRTPLHLAAMEGHKEIVGFILSRPEISREVVNDKDSFGYTPLHLAVRHSREDVVRLLTRSAWVLPDIFLAATSERDDVGAYCGGCTPLHLAAVGGDTTIPTLLLRQPRKLEFAYAPANINATNWNSETPLDLAQKNNFKDLMEVLENSDLNYLQQERARIAVSANAILVGAALVAAATSGAWLQPPGGIPNPDSKGPSPSSSHEYTPFFSKKGMKTSRIYYFFMFDAYAFLFSMLALVLGTLATFPIPASLKVEVKRLRRVVRKAQCFLVLALVYLVDSSAFAATVILYKYPVIDHFSTWMHYFIPGIPLFFHIFVSLYSFSFIMREEYGIEKLCIWIFLVTPAVLFIYAHLRAEF